MEGIEPNGTISSAMKCITNVRVLASILSWSVLASYKQDHRLEQHQKMEPAGTLITTAGLLMSISQDGVEVPLLPWILPLQVGYVTIY